MDGTEGFVVESNIAAFTTKLYEEHNPERRRMLQTLLLEEEDKFGTGVKQLQLAEHHIKESTVRIDKQRVLLDRMSAAGCDTTEAVRVLSNSALIFRLFKQYHACILAWLARIDL
jgi:hypothetical protein